MKKLLLLALLITIGLQTQAQINPCDSISYTITPGANTNLLELNGVIAGFSPASIDTIIWEWQVCDDQMCYTDTNPGSFMQFNTTDSLKACFDILMDISGATYTCYQCDSLVFGPNGWMLMNMGNPTVITELTFYHEVDDKIYDVLGRKWTCSFANLPKGLYIINNRKVLKTK